MKSHGSEIMMVSGDFNDRYQTWSHNQCGDKLGLSLDPRTYHG
jgi:hypothetical protein